MEIERNIATYLGARRPLDRYTSFDYCFNYFQSYRDDDRVAGLVAGPAMQLSCLQLGFYLASWGMFRGSTAMLQRSLRYLTPVVEVIARGDRKPGFDHAARPWYSWMSPPSRSLRRTSRGLTWIGSAAAASGGVRPRARWGRPRL